MPKLLTRVHAAITNHSADMFFSVTSPEKMEKLKMAKLPAKTGQATATPVAAAVAPVANGTQPAATPVAASAQPASHVAPAAVAPNADGVTTDEDDEKASRKLPKHPSLWDAAANEGKGAPVKIAAVPADFDASKHKPLAKKDFIDEAVFYDYAAKRCLEKAAAYEEKAKQSRLLGATADKASMKKFVAMQERIKELQKQILDATPPEMREAVQAQMNAQLAAMQPAADAAPTVAANVAGSDQ